MPRPLREPPSEDHIAARPRPLWQALILPLAGLSLVVLGIVGWILPFLPGVPLIVIALPLLVCFHPRLELRMRSWIRRTVRKRAESASERKRRRLARKLGRFFESSTEMARWH